MEKNRKIELDTNSIRKAVRDLEQMKKEINSLPINIEKILTDAVKYCKSITPVSDDEGNHLVDNTYWEKTTHGYRIVQEGESVSYVEFGTGEPGANSSHPQSSQYGWVYGAGEHIFETKDGKTGWFYPIDKNKTSYRFTQGRVANMQMYKTGLWLKERLGIEVKMVVRRATSKW